MLDCAHLAATYAADLAANRRNDLPASSAFYRGVCAGLLIAATGSTVPEAMTQADKLIGAALKRKANGKG